MRRSEWPSVGCCSAWDVFRLTKRNIVITDINCANWEEFERQLNEVRKGEAAAGRSVDLLHRGLATRTGSLKLPWSERPHQAHKAPDRELHLNQLGDEDFPEIDTLLRTYDAWNLVPISTIRHDRLRHHGFPSPLLDWTRSYHIAAFFAFRSCGTDDAGQVSLYALSVQPRGMHGRRLAEAAIRSTGSLITTHRRHFLQRSETTSGALENRALEVRTASPSKTKVPIPNTGIILHAALHGKNHHPRAANSWPPSTNISPRTPPIFRAIWLNCCASRASAPKANIAPTCRVRPSGWSIVSRSWG